MVEQKFDPFTDRLSRDIRNTLSRMFVKRIEAKRVDSFEHVVEEMFGSKLDSVYTEYIQDRVQKYERSLNVIFEEKYDDPIYQSLVLWDNGLFFEVHEVLEHAWYDAKDEYRAVLQALIRAAGVMIKREVGYHVQARKIAAKSVQVLKETTLLHRYCNVGDLIKSLQDEKVAPPKLLS